MFHALRCLLIPALVGAVLQPSAVSAAQRPPTATLVVQSSPRGADVLVDGRRLGRTPLRRRGLPAGVHSLIVSRRGYELQSQAVTLVEGETTTVNVSLPQATLLSREEKARRRAQFAGDLRRLRRWLRQTLTVFRATTAGGFELLRLPVSAARAPVKDPITGLYIQASAQTPDPSTLVVTVTYYSDSALTQEAGELTVTVTPGAVTAAYQFTGGSLAGVSGTVSGTVTGESTVHATAAGTLSDGSAYTAEFDLTITSGSFQVTGTVDVTLADGTTSHWDVTGSEQGGDCVITTSTGLTVTIHLNPDGSGTCVVSLTATGKVLATYTFNARGSASGTYSDGTTETFRVT